MNRLTEFKGEQVSFAETMLVTEGVTCDTYTFTASTAKDLGIVAVQRGCNTPLQRVVKGDRTIEGHLSGCGTLTVETENNPAKTYSFDGQDGGEVVVAVGQTMQWVAAQDSDLVFYEICEPPYEDGRFENLAEL
jgi:hypothetical protein